MLRLMVTALEIPETQQQAQSATAKALKSLTTQTLGEALDLFATTSLIPMVAKEVLRRPKTKVSAALRQRAQTLSQPARLKPRPTIGAEAADTVTFILPLSDNAAGRFGQRLRKDLELRDMRLAEDRIGGTRITLEDGSTVEAVAAAFERVSNRGEGAVVGLFDRVTLPHAIEAAHRHALPTLMLTSSGRGRNNDAPTWRILPTSSHAVLAAAGALRDRGTRKVLVIHGPEKRSARRAKQLAKVWRRHCQDTRTDCTVTALMGPAADAERLATEASKLDFDAIYLPVSAVHAAQVLKYLATHDIWANHKGKSARANSDVRRVTVVGTTEWYSETGLGLLGSYGHGALVPVPFALETARGERISHLLEQGIDPARRTVLVIALDAFEALRAARRAASEAGISIADALKKQGYSSGATVGFDFTRKHALRPLMLLEVTPQGFRPHQAD